MVGTWRCLWSSRLQWFHSRCYGAKSCQKRTQGKRVIFGEGRIHVHPVSSFAKQGDVSITKQLWLALCCLGLRAKREKMSAKSDAWTKSNWKYDQKSLHFQSCVALQVDSASLEISPGIVGWWQRPRTFMQTLDIGAVCERLVQIKFCGTRPISFAHGTQSIQQQKCSGTHRCWDGTL